MFVLEFWFLFAWNRTLDSMKKLNLNKWFCFTEHLICLLRFVHMSLRYSSVIFFTVSFATTEYQFNWIRIKLCLSWLVSVCVVVVVGIVCGARRFSFTEYIDNQLRRSMFMAKRKCTRIREMRIRKGKNIKFLSHECLHVGVFHIRYSMAPIVLQRIIYVDEPREHISYSALTKQNTNVSSYKCRCEEKEKVFQRQLKAVQAEECE